MTHLHAEGTTQRHPIPTAAVVVIALAIFVVGVIGGAGIGWLRQSDAWPPFQPSPAPASSTTLIPDPTSSSPAPPSPSPTTTTPSPSPTPPTKEEAERQAREELETLAADGYATANPRGQWVAQLSSKYIGITDPNQTAEVSGGHKFLAVDIVAEYNATKQKAEQLGASVVLIKGSDIKKGRDERSNHLFWYIFGVDFGSKSEAERWCQDLYPGLSGARLKNVCFPTQLKP